MALIKTTEAAKRLGRSTYTLADWRRDGHGPPWVKLRTECMYDEADLEAFISERMVNSLAEECAGRRRLDDASESSPLKKNPTTAATGSGRLRETRSLVTANVKGSITEMPEANNDPLWDRLNRFEEKSIEYWKPNVGDVVIGEILDIDVRTAKHSGRTPVLTIQDEITSRPVEVWAMHTVLRNELTKLAPSAGDRIAIKRLPDSQKGYRRFIVESDSAHTTVDWDTISAPGST